MPYRDNAYSDTPFCNVVKKVAEESRFNITKKAMETTTVEYNLLVKPHILKLAEEGKGETRLKDLEELLTDCHLETLKTLLMNDLFSLYRNHNGVGTQYTVSWYTEPDKNQEPKTTLGSTKRQGNGLPR